MRVVYLSARKATAFIDLAARQSTNNFQATTEISRDRFSVLFVACRSVELIAVFLVPGPAGYRFFFSGMRTAFPDLNVAAETVVQDGDSLAFAYTLTGTHNGPLGKIPPTGKKVKIRGVQISKFKDGKMVERWGSSDELTLLKQIGVIP